MSHNIKTPLHVYFYAKNIVVIKYITTQKNLSSNHVLQISYIFGKLDNTASSLSNSNILLFSPLALNEIILISLISFKILSPLLGNVNSYLLTLSVLGKKRSAVTDSR